MAGLRVLGAYREPPSERRMVEVEVGGATLPLTPSQRDALDRVASLASEREGEPDVIPAYVAADTGAGKSHLALVAAAALARRMSEGLRMLHAVYLAPTKFLAGQMGDRAERLASILREALPGAAVVEVRGDLDRDLKAERVAAALSRGGARYRLMATNPQMLASLATKRSTRYHGDRRMPYELISALAEPNLYVVDEPHFFRGKSFVRLLSLLLEIARWKSAASVVNPTVILFLSATMDPRAIDGALSRLERVVGVNVLARDLPLRERTIRLEDREAGEKEVVVTEGSWEAAAGEIIEGARRAGFTAVYADSVNLLVRLQDRMEGAGLRAALLHSQMPRDRWDRQLEAASDPSTDAVLMTSVGEVGVELEELGREVDLMYSLNPQSVAKTVQRLGRLARRRGSSGTFVSVDLPWARVRVSRRLANGLVPGDPDLPEFLPAARAAADDLFESYLSERADSEFFEILRRAVRRGRRAPSVYLVRGIEVQPALEGEEPVTLPLFRVAAGRVPISSREEMEVIRGSDGRLYYSVVDRAADPPGGRLELRLSVADSRGVQPLEELPGWAREIGVKRVVAVWGAELAVRVPVVGGEWRARAPALEFWFRRSFSSSTFPFSEKRAKLEEALRPASHDLEFLPDSVRPSKVVAFEPVSLLDPRSVGRHGVGAVEAAVEMLSG